MAKKVKMDKNEETNVDRAIKNELKKYVPFVGWLLVLFLMFLALYFVFQGLGKVNYQGLTFVMEKYGEVQVYHYSYVAKLANGNARVVDVFLRGNPAKNNVPISGEVIYPEARTVHISINGTGLNVCNYSQVAMASLAGFLVNNNLAVKVGTPDKNEAEMKNTTYVTCSSWPANTVISIKSGAETKITRTENLCYNIEVANCEIMPAIEKFIVQSIIDAKKSSN